MAGLNQHGVNLRKFLPNFPVSIPVPTTLGTRLGLNVNGCLLGNLETAVKSCLILDASGPTFTDLTAEINDPVTGTVTVGPTGELFDVGDYIAFGSDAKFSGIKMVISTKGQGDAVAAETEWEYYNGSAWVDLATAALHWEDDSSDFTATAATGFTTFQPPSDWAVTSLNSGDSLYWIRFRSTAIDAFNTDEAEMTNAVLLGHNVSSGKIGALTHCYNFDASGPTYTDEKTDINDAGASDVATFTDGGDEGDAFYIGGTRKFNGFVTKIGTAGVASTDSMVWQYWNGVAWTSLESVAGYNDESTHLTAGTGVYLTKFDKPADWVVTIVNSVSGFFIRLYCVANDEYTATVPLLTQGWLIEETIVVGQRMLFPCEVTAVVCTALHTNSGTTDNSTFVLVNVTRGTHVVFTWTAADAVDRISGLSLLFNEGDEYVLQMIDKDGTTEFIDVEFRLECLLTGE